MLNKTTGDALMSTAEDIECVCVCVQHLAECTQLRVLRSGVEGMLDWLFQWGRERTGLFWRELLPPGSQLPVLGNRLWLLQKEKRINIIHSFPCAPHYSYQHLFRQVCTWSVRSVSSPVRRVRLMSFRSTCAVWSGTCHSHCVGNAGVSVHPGTVGEAVGRGTGVGEGDLCVGRQPERT